jgi:hypothetical protein
LNNQPEPAVAPWLVQAGAALLTTFVVLVAGVTLSMLWIAASESGAPHPELFVLVLFLAVAPAYVITFAVTALVANAFDADFALRTVLAISTALAAPVAFLAFGLSRLALN